jgi:beta-mannosidase
VRAAASGTVLAGFALAATDAAVRDPEELAGAGPEWLPAVVPGGVHESLLAAGRIPHPYGPGGAERVRWVEDATWWYRVRFAAPAAGAGPVRVRLVCHGLDTVAELFLNGAPIGAHRSQFRPADIDVTGRLAADGGENELLIRFDPPLSGLTAPPGPAETLRLMRAGFTAGLAAMLPPDADPSEVAPPGVLAVDPAATLRRKATYSWGWDFAPRLPSIGVAAPIELRVSQAAELTDAYVRTLRAEPHGGLGTAEVEVTVGADAFAHPGPLTVRATLTGPDGEAVVRTLPLPPGGAGPRTASATVRLDRAHLWWPHDLGAPHLYTLRTELYAADGALLDARESAAGLRTVALDRSPDAEEGGRLFRFLVNGVPIFARGANWVPPDMLTGAVPDDAYTALVGMAVRANMNMLRVWGGGVYPPDAFFAACDAAGILVWQDFMFACVDYPDDDADLAAEVAAEAAHQVRRLRGRPSLALLCGNNEVQTIHAGLRGGLGGTGWGRAFFDTLLPEMVARLAPGVPYWPGSPYGEHDPAGVNGVRDGDRHAWEVWHGQDQGAGGPSAYPSRGAAVHFTRYAHDRGKFVSEFGIHSAPEPGTLRRWAGPLDAYDAEFARRITDAPMTKGDDLLAYETGPAADLASYADFSMAAQAEGMKFGVEHYRRRRPHCSGALIWQFNDVWPGMSWSLLDYDRVAKAAYYFAQRAFRPVLASFTWSPERGLALWVTNDLRTEARVRLRAQVTTFAGETVLDEEVAANVRAGGSAPVWSAAAERVGAGPDRFAWVSAASGDGLAGANRLFFGPLKRQRFGPSRLETRVLSAAPGRAELEVASYGYTYLARVPAPAAGVAFDANYLDLRDGDRVRIQVTGLPPGFDPAGLSASGYAGARRPEAP